MTGVARSVRQRLSALALAWQSFWFQPQQMYTLGVVRMAFGALAVMWGLWLLPMRNGLLDADGVTPKQPSTAYTWGIFAVWNTNAAMLIGIVALVSAALALTVGWHSRLAAVLVFVLVMSFERRVPLAFNGGDVLVRIEALFLAISPCGAALSLDQRRRTGSFWSAQTRPNWPIRLMQVQLSLIYFAAAQAKLSGGAWLHGTAVSYVLRLEDMQRVTAPEWLSTNALAMNMVTWAVIATELAVGIFVWFPRLRPWALALGVLMHLSIDVFIQIGVFSYALFVMYLAWLSPETVKLLPEKLRSGSSRRGRRSEPAGQRVGGGEQVRSPSGAGPAADAVDRS
jgi:hypothetical protein